MSISVACASCGNKYNLSDSLAGKKVKCRNCGSIIAVPSDVLELEDDEQGGGGAESGRGLEGDRGVASGRTCRMCGAISQGSSEICLVCGHEYRDVPAASGAGAAAGAGRKAVEEEDKPEGKKRSRFLRATGNATLNSLDRTLQFIIFGLLGGGVITWAVHVYLVDRQISFGLFAPMLVAGVALFLVLAPAMAITVKSTCEALHYPPRHDNYVRAAAALGLPFAVSLLCSGSLVEVPTLNALIFLSWLLGIGLLLYFFRAEPIEWGISLAAGIAAMFLACLVLGFVAPYFSKVTGPLYQEYSPQGPWSMLAGDHVPPPPAPENPTVKNSPAVAVGVATPENTSPQTPSPGPGPVAVQPQPGVVQTPVTPGTTPVPTISSPSIATPVIPLPEAPAGVDLSRPVGLENIHYLRISAPTSNHFLAVKSAGDQTSVERWALLPTVAKTGEQHFDELPGEPNEYLLSPSGMTLVTLTRFPQVGLVFSSFDDKIAPRKVSLDRKEWTGTPTLVGFIDASRFLVRWNESGLLQVWSTDGNMVSFNKLAAISDAPNTWSISSDTLGGGVKIGVLAHGQPYTELGVFRVEGWQTTQRFVPMKYSFTTRGLAISPDGMTIALCAQITDGGTLTAYNTRTGDNLWTTILPAASFQAAHGAGAGGEKEFPHGLVWTKDGALLVFNGNILFDAATGKRLGALGIANAVDCGPLTGDTLAVIQQNGDTRSVVFAKTHLAVLRGK